MPFGQAAKPSGWTGFQTCTHKWDALCDSIYLFKGRVPKPWPWPSCVKPGAQAYNQIIERLRLLLSELVRSRAYTPCTGSSNSSPASTTHTIHVALPPACRQYVAVRNIPCVFFGYYPTQGLSWGLSMPCC